MQVLGSRVSLNMVFGEAIVDKETSGITQQLTLGSNTQRKTAGQANAVAGFKWVPDQLW